VLEFRARVDVFALLRAGALVEDAITNWRFDTGLLLRLTFHAPNLTVEHGSQRQQVGVSWYSPYQSIVRPHLHCPACNRGCYGLFEVGGIGCCFTPASGSASWMLSPRDQIVESVQIGRKADGNPRNSSPDNDSIPHVILEKPGRR
jgi:hypothetical protein